MSHTQPSHFTEADWLALAVFGRERADGRKPTPVVVNGVQFSRASVALLYANVGWLQALFAGGRHE